jgi:hypothetical protein
VCVNGEGIGEKITSDKTDFVTLVGRLDRHGREFINRNRKEQTQNLRQEMPLLATLQIDSNLNALGDGI